MGTGAAGAAPPRGACIGIAAGTCDCSVSACTFITRRTSPSARRGAAAGGAAVEAVADVASACARLCFVVASRAKPATLLLSLFKLVCGRADSGRRPAVFAISPALFAAFSGKDLLGGGLGSSAPPPTPEIPLPPFPRVTTLGSPRPWCVSSLGAVDSCCCAGRGCCGAGVGGKGFAACAAYVCEK